MNKRQMKKQNRYDNSWYSLKRKWCRSCQSTTPQLHAFIELVNDTCPLWKASSSECGCALTEKGMTGEDMNCVREKPCHGGTMFSYACVRCEKNRYGQKISGWSYPTWPRKGEKSPHELKSKTKAESNE